jgi:hypothetical protein
MAARNQPTQPMPTILSSCLRLRLLHVLLLLLVCVEAQALVRQVVQRGPGVHQGGDALGDVGHGVVVGHADGQLQGLVQVQHLRQLKHAVRVLARRRDLHNGGV